MLPDHVKHAPEEVFEVTRCRCSMTHCKNKMCSCVEVNLKCTNYCECNEKMCESHDNKILLFYDSDCDLSDDSE